MIEDLELQDKCFLHVVLIRLAYLDLTNNVLLAHYAQLQRQLNYAINASWQNNFYWTAF